MRASSPERAYARALKLGQQAESQFLNTADKMVQVIFRGLRDLCVIYDDLRSGSKLIYEERLDLTEEQVAKLVPAKEARGVFVDRVKPTRHQPYTMPKDIMQAPRRAGFDDSDLYNDK